MRARRRLGCARAGVANFAAVRGAWGAGREQALRHSRLAGQRSHARRTASAALSRARVRPTRRCERSIRPPADASSLTRSWSAQAPGHARPVRRGVADLRVPRPAERMATSSPARRRRDSHASPEIAAFEGDYATAAGAPAAGSRATRRSVASARCLSTYAPHARTLALRAWPLRRGRAAGRGWARARRRARSATQMLWRQVQALVARLRGRARGGRGAGARGGRDHRPNGRAQLPGRRALRPRRGARRRRPHRGSRRRARAGARALRAQEEPGHGRAGAALEELRARVS